MFISSLLAPSPSPSSGSSWSLSFGQRINFGAERVTQLPWSQGTLVAISDVKMAMLDATSFQAGNFSGAASPV